MPSSTFVPPRRSSEETLSLQNLSGKAVLACFVSGQRVQWNGVAGAVKFVGKVFCREMIHAA